MKWLLNKKLFSEKKNVRKVFRASELKESFFLFSYVRPYWRYFAAGLVFVLLNSIVAMAFPYFLKQLIDSAQASLQNERSLDTSALFFIIIGMLFLQMIFSFLRVYYFTLTGEHTVADMRRSIYQHIIQMPMVFFSQRRVGELSNRISADLSQVQHGMVAVLSDSLKGIITLIVGLLFIIYINLNLTLVLLSGLPILIFITRRFSKAMRQYAIKTQDQLSDTNIIVQETLLGIANVKAFANEVYEMNRYASSLQKLVKTALASGQLRGVFSALMNFLVYSAIIAVVWYGITLKQRGLISFGDLTAFIMYAMMVALSISGFADLYSQLQKMLGSTTRLKELLASPTEQKIDPLKKPDNLPRFSGLVGVNNITFHYPSKPDIAVLKNVSFDVKPGEKVAIVGPSGAGKTTFISLLLRFYDPTTGKIFFDGIDTGTIPIAHLRDQIAVVPQDVLLFGGSVSENIAYGKPGATQEEIEEAARKAHAHEFICSFPEGYNALVGERGIKLSGGQRQRIAIARAILKNASILILDEATSSLDSSSEMLVQQALNTLFKGRTAFIIAHRLSTIRSADKIVVIDQGVIREIGTHSQLITEEDSLYKNLNELQFRDY